MKKLNSGVASRTAVPHPEVVGACQASEVAALRHTSVGAARPASLALEARRKEVLLGLPVEGRGVAGQLMKQAV